jgi:hypothetical protein
LPRSVGEPSWSHSTACWGSRVQRRQREVFEHTPEPPTASSLSLIPKGESDGVALVLERREFPDLAVWLPDHGFKRKGVPGEQTGSEKPISANPTTWPL